MNGAGRVRVSVRVGAWMVFGGRGPAALARSPAHSCGVSRCLCSPQLGGATALTEAAGLGSLARLALLIRLGADPDLPRVRGPRLPHPACYCSGVFLQWSVSCVRGTLVYVPSTS